MHSVRALSTEMKPDAEDPWRTEACELLEKLGGIPEEE